MQSGESDETLHGEPGMTEPRKDYAASVLARLLNHSRQHKENFQSLLTRYVGERFLFRLGESSFRSSYVLKGAYLLTIVLEDQTYRTTKDIDFLKSGKTDTDSIRESLESSVRSNTPRMLLHSILHPFRSRISGNRMSIMDRERRYGPPSERHGLSCKLTSIMETRYFPALSPKKYRL